MANGEAIIKNTVRTPPALDERLNACAKEMNYSKNALFLIGAKLVLEWARADSEQTADKVAL